eukprot:5531321-Amphidinium_carterae.1
MMRRKSEQPPTSASRPQPRRKRETSLGPSAFQRQHLRRGKTTPVIPHPALRRERQPHLVQLLKKAPTSHWGMANKVTLPQVLRQRLRGRHTARE